MYPFRKILVATELDAASAGALDLGSGLALEYEAELIIAHVIEMYIPALPLTLMPELEDIQRAGRRSLDTLVERVHAVWPRVSGALLWGSPAEQIVQYAHDAECDLVIVGTHGRRGPSRWLVGSVAQKVTRSAHIPVLTVHEGDDRPGGPVEPLRPLPADRRRAENPH